MNHKLNSLTILHRPGEEDRKAMKASDSPTFTGCSVELIFSTDKGTCYEKPKEANWPLSKPCFFSSNFVNLKICEQIILHCFDDNNFEWQWNNSHCWLYVCLIYLG